MCLQSIGNMVLLHDLKKGEKIAPFLTGGYATISLGYIGIYEACRLITGESNTGEHGRVFAMKIMDRLNQAIYEWRDKHNLGLWSLWYAC